MDWSAESLKITYRNYEIMHPQHNFMSGDSTGERMERSVSYQKKEAS